MITYEFETTRADMPAYHAFTTAQLNTTVRCLAYWIVLGLGDFCKSCAFAELIGVLTTTGVQGLAVRLERGEI